MGWFTEQVKNVKKIEGSYNIFYIKTKFVRFEHIALQQAKHEHK